MSSENIFWKLKINVLSSQLFVHSPKGVQLQKKEEEKNGEY